ncbi:MAG: alpha/beta fold hydrolase, partial [Pseudonocardia sp.]|nr:alpha/beta fold hydrolase [Pseudonocardia sp.]
MNPVLLPPASGAWREGDDPGRRRFLDLESPLKLEAGGELAGVRLSYETWGTLAPDASNAVLVLHALTGDPHLEGPAERGHPTAGWWPGLIGPGQPLDPERWFVVSPNSIGGCQGSTGPSSTAPDGRAWGSRFPLVTPRDTVAAERHLADALGIERWACVVGGSMGAMRSLEWAATEPGRVERLFLLAGPAASSADQIGWAAPQIEAIQADPNFRGGDYYDGGRYAIESYLDHHAEKL